MNSNQNIPNDSINLKQNTNPSINFNLSQSSQNINSSLVPKDISTITHIISKQNQANENKNSIIIKSAQFEEKKYQSNMAPFKSFVNERHQISSNSNLLDNPFNKISSNPFSQKSKSEININTLHGHNPKASNDNDCLILKTFENNCKINKSQINRNSFNINPLKSKELSNEISNGIIRIKVYRSHVKPKRATKFNRIENKSNIYDVNSEIKNDNKTNNNNNNIVISDFNDKKYKYRLLIKRIALQLKRKIKPPTKGYFYVSIIRTDKYMNIVKKIAKKMKNKICPPTHGFFYIFIEKQKQYKLLIKKIAFQLKKRIHLPTCKIIKIYESYTLLIKRIAISLRNSMKKKEKITCVISGNNNIYNVANNSNNNKIGETNNINQEMDTTMDIDIDVENNKNKKEVNNKDEINAENKIQSLTFTKTNVPYFTQNITNNNSNYIFSKMGIIQEEIPKSAEQNKKNILKNNCFNLNINNNDNNDKIEIEQIEQIKKIEKNQKESSIPMKINTNFLANDLNQEIINKTEKSQTEYVLKEKEEKLVEEKIVERKSQQNPEKKEEIFKIEKDSQNKLSKQIFKNRRDSKYIKSVPCLTKQNKNIYFNMTLFTKENLIKENEERKIHNKSHSKNNININLNNFSTNNDNLNHKDNIQNINEKITLTEIETGKPNFINKFQKFLEQEKIEIVDNFPISLNESHKTYFQQSNFWYLIICYIFYINNNLSLYSVIHLLEQYNIWTKEKDEDIFYSLKQKIVEYINNNYSNEIIKQFLFMNKLKDIHQIFEKFENCYAKNGEKANKVYEYKEIKVDSINIINNGEYLKCNCDLCVNDEACVKKVCDLNKNKIHIVNDSFINITQLTPEEQMQNLIQKINNNNIFHNNEALFFKGISKKKQNNIFSKSKTIIEENTNIEYNYLPKVNNEIKNVTTPNNIDNIDGNAADNNDNNINENINDNVIDNAQTTNEVMQEEKNNDNDDNIIEKDERKKNFKNISKMKPEHNQDNNTHNINEIEKENKNDICMKSIKEEGNGDENEMEKKEKEEEENKKEDDKNEKEKEKQKEEEDSDDEDNKSNKKEKKSRKGGKSRNNKNKKKKEITKIKNDIINEKENDKEINENDEKEDEKSCKKKRKVGGNNIKKKNKSKVVEDEERNELEEMLKEDGIENKKDDENICENNSDNSN